MILNAPASLTMLDNKKVDENQRQFLMRKVRGEKKRREESCSVSRGVKWCGVECCTIHMVLFCAAFAVCCLCECSDCVVCHVLCGCRLHTESYLTLLTNDLSLLFTGGHAPRGHRWVPSKGRTEGRKEERALRKDGCR